MNRPTPGWFRHAPSVPLAIAALLATSGGAGAQPCTPEWSALGTGVNNNQVFALTVFDGSLIAGGMFTAAGGVAGTTRIARWDGQGWSALGSGINNLVFTLGTFEGGLYAGGSFTAAGVVPALRVARWDGTAWSALGSGIDGGYVRSLTVFDDGTGAALYTGGFFTSAGGVPANHIARWDGLAWSAPGIGMDSPVWPIAGFGGDLYAGGFFTIAGGVPAVYISRWDGESWSPVGSGGLNGAVLTLALFDGDLYAGGFFTTAGGVIANQIARWDGAAWSALGTGVAGGNVQALAAFDDGSGPALYVGGAFTSAGGVAGTGRIARWDGESWSSVAGGTNNAVNALTVYDDGGGPALYVGGGFTNAGGVPANRIARWGCPPAAPCYANCDGSTTAPVLNVQDFSCFLARYAAGEAYANCDGSTTAPVLNVEDFSCFLNEYAAGCS
ncbi:MAG: GC-type dockerin domain-anchored protein [Phycisphaerales bacterium]